MDKECKWRDAHLGAALNGMPMTSYAVPTTVRVDQLKPNDLVRVNKLPKEKHELEIWATVLEIAPVQHDHGTKVSIQLAGGYKFEIEAGQHCTCRVPADH